MKSEHKFVFSISRLKRYISLYIKRDRILLILTYLIMITLIISLLLFHSYSNTLLFIAVGWFLFLYIYTYKEKDYMKLFMEDLWQDAAKYRFPLEKFRNTCKYFKISERSIWKFINSK